MATPIKPHPERERCAYEKLREVNIREREEAMKESGFFESLTEYKMEIGFSEEKKIKRKPIRKERKTF